MSIEIMSLIWKFSKQEGTALLMLLAIADHANDEGICWPSVQTLANKCRLSKRQATRLIQKLESEGELVIDQGGGRGHSNLYKVTPVTGFIEDRTAKDRVTSTAPFSEETVTSEAIKGDIQRERVTSMTKKDDTGDTRIIKEPSLKSSLNQDIQSFDQTPWVQALIAIQSTHYRNDLKAFRQFWENTEYGGRQDGKFVVICGDEDQRDWLADRGKMIAEHILVSVLGKYVEVEFVIR